MRIRVGQLSPVFVDNIPPLESMQPGILYLSIKYCGASHRCACGCGLEVVTPLKPGGWTMHFDGSVSLTPSIGNQQFPCRSHYVIRNNVVQWLPQFTRAEAEAARLGYSKLPEKLATARESGLKELLRRLFGNSGPNE
jgi:hypothetical protein